MDEDEAILYLLDLGVGGIHRSKEILDVVTEIQESCGLEKGDEKELHERLVESDSVSVEKGIYRL